MEDWMYRIFFVIAVLCGLVMAFLLFSLGYRMVQAGAAETPCVCAEKEKP